MEEFTIQFVDKAVEEIEWVEEFIPLVLFVSLNDGSDERDLVV